MQHQQGLLIGRLDRHKPHRWACHGLTDGGCVGGIVFRPFDIALHIARRHQTHGVAELGDFTCPMMSGSASFHADQASRNPAKQFNDLLPSQLSGDDDVASTIHAVHLEYMLGEINADGANLHVDDPPPVIRCSTITLLAHSMPGAGVVHYIIFDRAVLVLSARDVRLAPRATAEQAGNAAPSPSRREHAPCWRIGMGPFEILHISEITNWAESSEQILARGAYPCDRRPWSYS